MSRRVEVRCSGCSAVEHFEPERNDQCVSQGQPGGWFRLTVVLERVKYEGEPLEAGGYTTKTGVYAVDVCSWSCAAAVFQGRRQDLKGGAISDKPVYRCER